LSQEEWLALERLIKKSADWRALECAKILLLLGQSLLCREVAQLQDLNICTVGQTWQHWRQEGMGCLSDKPCSGHAGSL
jgi:transposase